jgi:hypothetical protein
MSRTAQLIGVLGAIGVTTVVVALAASLPARPTGPGNAPLNSEATASPEGTQVAPSSEPTQTASAEPSTLGSPGATSGTLPTPSTADPLAQSDSFWNRWIGPPNPGVLSEFQAESLADITDQADLIIRGKVADLYVGEYWRGLPEEEPFPLAYVRVEVIEVLKGEPASRVPGYVEVLLGSGGDDLDELLATIPSHDHLWFLMHGLKWDERIYEPQRSSELAQYAYFVFNFHQGLLRDIDGVVAVMRPEYVAGYGGPEFYPLPIDGSDFASVVEQVRELVESTEGPTPTSD